MTEIKPFFKPFSVKDALSTVNGHKSILFILVSIILSLDIEINIKYIIKSKKSEL